MLFTLLFLVLSGCSLQSNAIKKDTSLVTPMPKSNEISIVSYRWHTGFIIPADIIQQALPQLKTRFSNVPFLEFGWGDKGFYQAKKVTFGLTLQAALVPTESVVRVGAITKKAKVFFPNNEVRTLCLDDEHYTALVNFIKNSFLTKNDGKIVSLTKGLTGNSQFYKGEGSYHLMNTCNTWTARGLKDAGLEISPTFKFTASSIIDYLDQDKSTRNNACVVDVIGNKSMR